MPDVTLVKLGGSLLTDKEKPQTAREDVIRRLAKEIAQARKSVPEALVIGHGSGSFGHDAAHRHGLEGRLETPKQLKGVSATQVLAAQLHRRVADALHEAGASPYSIAPSSFFVASGGRTAVASLEPLLKVLDLGLVPVIYGDVVTDRVLGATILSTETLIKEVIVRLQRRIYRVRRVLWMGETDGIYGADGKTIERVTGRNLDQVRKAIGPARGTDVTGGMHLRLDSAWELARKGVDSWILDGRKPGLLKRCLTGEATGGTLVQGSRSTRSRGTRAKTRRHPTARF
ncbi:MAG: isopentenyl phosphate kinase family protein [Acidobacteria bacterium]|nr:isopentenyl phosphate kinase family protein [Acidobacteriota bacterium]